MRRRDLLKVGAGTAAAGVLTATGGEVLQILHVVGAEGSEVLEVQDLVFETQLHPEAGYSVLTNFPVEVQHVPLEHFEQGLLFFSAEGATPEETDCLAAKIKESGYVQWDRRPIVSNFFLSIQHVEESHLREGILLVTLPEKSKEESKGDMAHLQNRFWALGCDPNRIIFTDHRIETRHFDDAQHAINTLEFERWVAQTELNEMLKYIDYCNEFMTDAEFREAVVSEAKNLKDLLYQARTRALT